MKKATCILRSTNTPVAFCKPLQIEKLSNESHADFEKRTWKEKAHYDPEGNAFIPGIMFKKAIESAAKFLNLKIPGEGKATFTKNFKAGVAITRGIPLNTSRDTIEGDWQFVPSDGKPNSSSPRVYKCFPQVGKWSGGLEVTILDDKITEEIFSKVLKAAGAYIGVGRFRPINGGDKGRFIVEDIKWEGIED